jgi:hypothetical protein
MLKKKKKVHAVFYQVGFILILYGEIKTITDPYLGKITSVLFHFIDLGFDGGYPKGLLTLWI